MWLGKVRNGVEYEEGGFDGGAERVPTWYIPAWVPPSMMLKFSLSHAGGFSKSGVSRSKMT